MDPDRWPARKARQWYNHLPWLVGCNFIPSTAINQIEMWQESTFDAATMARELGWASELGFNTVRVYLHDLVWAHDAEAFKRRIMKFLDTAAQYGLRTLFVLFDDCWFSHPAIGKQPAPIPGRHNSGWVQSPGKATVEDPTQWGRLKTYVQDIIGTLATDQRVLMWDLYNEPGNHFLPSLSSVQPVKAFSLMMRFFRLVIQNRSLPLVKKTFAWARAAGPSQPLTSGVWFRDCHLNRYLFDVCDVITFHNYNGAKDLEKQIRKLKQPDRPVICTEYLARTRGSRFETHLPIFKREHVGCYNWGLVTGKTQTRYPWQSKKGAAEPDIWFHDILTADGKPHLETEVTLIREVLKAPSIPELSEDRERDYPQRQG